MRTFVFTPSSALCEVEIGQEFMYQDGKWYILLSRNSFSCTVGRETLLDKALKFMRGDKSVRSKYEGK